MKPTGVHLSKGFSDVKALKNKVEGGPAMLLPVEKCEVDSVPGGLLIAAKSRPFFAWFLAAVAISGCGSSAKPSSVASSAPIASTIAQTTSPSTAAVSTSTTPLPPTTTRPPSTTTTVATTTTQPPPPTSPKSAALLWSSRDHKLVPVTSGASIAAYDRVDQTVKIWSNAAPSPTTSIRIGKMDSGVLVQRLVSRSVAEGFVVTSQRQVPQDGINPARTLTHVWSLAAPYKLPPTEFDLEQNEAPTISGGNLIYAYAGVTQSYSATDGQKTWSGEGHHGLTCGLSSCATSSDLLDAETGEVLSQLAGRQSVAQIGREAGDEWVQIENNMATVIGRDGPIAHASVPLGSSGRQYHVFADFEKKFIAIQGLGGTAVSSLDSGELLWANKIGYDDLASDSSAQKAILFLDTEIMVVSVSPQIATLAMTDGHQTGTSKTAAPITRLIAPTFIAGNKAVFADADGFFVFAVMPRTVGLDQTGTVRVAP